jgi:LCP family protein required for cell wall assembly
MPPTPGGGDGAGDADRRHEHLQALPGMGDDPVVWDPRAGAFVPAGRASGEDAWPSDAGLRGPNADAGLRGPNAEPGPVAAAPAAPEAPPAADPAMPARRHVVINAGERAVRGGGAVVAGAPPAPAPPGRLPGTAAPGGPAGPVAPPPPAPRPQPGPSRRPSLPRPRLRARRLVAPLLSLPVLIGVLAFAFAYVKFNQIPRVPVSWALSPASAGGTNWLIVGTDSREGVTADDPNAGVLIGPGAPSGNRTDSIMVLRVGADGQQSLLSIPRDLRVKDPKTGQPGRINGTFNAGPVNLISAVKDIGIPVHHYLEINFVGFGKLVDSVGGIDVDFPFPARDTHSGLDIPTAGLQRLDGSQALAYVRSRYYEELKDGKWVSDPYADLSRVQRQRSFLTALMGKVSATKNPLAIGGITDAMSGGLRLDDQLNLFGAIGLARQLRGFHPESMTLPTVNGKLGSSLVLDLDTPKAAPVIQRFAA